MDHMPKERWAVKEGVRGRTWAPRSASSATSRSRSKFMLAPLQTATTV